MRLTELVTPLKPLEAMAMGKALVASDVGGHRELIQNNETGLLFPAGNVNILSECLCRILVDDDLRIHIQMEGFQWVREMHRWDRTTEVYKDIYSRAIGL